MEERIEVVEAVETVETEVMEDQTPEIPLPMIAAGAAAVVATGGLAVLGYNLYQKHKHPDIYEAKKLDRQIKRRNKLEEKIQKTKARRDEAIAKVQGGEVVDEDFEDDVE